MRRRRLAIGALAAAAVIGLTGCGGDDESANGGNGDGGGGGGQEVRLEAVDNKFKPANLPVPAGETVTVVFTNTGDNPHTFTASDVDVDTGIVDPGDEKSVTFTAPDEDIEFVCTVHESQGMVGTLGAE